MQPRSQDPRRTGQFVPVKAGKAAAAPRKKQSKWDIEARSIVRAEMERRGITYKQLALDLERMGEPETERNLISRVSRGTFTFAFAIKCLRAMGATRVTIAAPD